MEIILSNKSIFKNSITVEPCNKNIEEIRDLLDELGCLIKDEDTKPYGYVFNQKRNKLYYFLPEITNNLEVLTAYSKLARLLLSTNIKNANIKSPPTNKGKFDIETDKLIILGLMLGSYKPTYRGKVKEEADKDIKINYITKHSSETIIDIYNEAKIIADAINKVRTICNTPANIYNTLQLALDCEIRDTGTKIERKTLRKEDILKENMYALYAVGKGSKKENEPYVVTTLCKAKTIADYKVAIVGKGVVYDTGGLSIKPSDSMITMKVDKTGAVVVSAIIRAVEQLKLSNVEVFGVCGIVENAIGSRSYKPGDIMYTKSGKSVEITNTDAEGRLVLADCLTYVQEHYQPDLIIDIATLTGACKVGLGPHTFGVFGNDRKLIDEFIEVVNETERCESILLDHSLEYMLKSNLADMVNAPSSRYGGAITAGLFLDKFIEDKYKDKWIHLDICGTAHSDSEWDFHPTGASGASVYSILKYLVHLDRACHLEKYNINI